MFERDIYLQVRENVVQARDVRRQQVARRVASAPFSHQRSLVGKFSVADRLVREAVREVSGSGLFRRLRILVHPLGNVDGGLTEVEERVLQELARGAGAAKVVVWVGDELSDDAVVQRLNGS